MDSPLVVDFLVVSLSALDKYCYDFFLQFRRSIARILQIVNMLCWLYNVKPNKYFLMIDRMRF